MVPIDYSNASARFRAAHAASLNQRCNEAVSLDDSWAYLSARGLALDKQPGVRPLGIPHSEFCLEANALILVAGEDVELLLGAANLCGGLRAGLEGGCHAMWKQFEEDPEVEVVFLIW